MKKREWESEPDLEVFESHGYRCVISRNKSLKSLNGYVGIPATHPLFGTETAEHNECLALLKARRLNSPPMEHEGIYVMLGMLVGSDDVLSTPSGAFIVHGGLSYSNMKCPPDFQDDNLWYFGFDCGHAWDFQPGMAELLFRLSDPLYMEEMEESAGQVYRNMDYVRDEVMSLADQLHSLTTALLPDDY